MANLYWVGGCTSTSGSYTNSLGNFSGMTGTANMDWVLAFDWNNPGNWYQRVSIGDSGGFEGGSGSNSQHEINIGQYDMTNSSLDFTVRPNIDKFNFGLRSGYNIYGGIIFRDENSTIIGSDGIKLWNDQIVTGVNNSTRQGAVSTAPVEIPDTAE